MTTPAAQRIRRFSAVPLSIGLLVCALAVGIAALSQYQHWDRMSFSPWELPDQRPVTVSGGGSKWSAPRSAYIDLTESGAFELTMTGSPAFVGLEYMAPHEIGTSTYPRLLGFVSNSTPRQIFISQPGARLWLTTPDPWAMEVREIPLSKVTGGNKGDPASSYEGSGEAMIWYEGDAVRGVITQQGTGALDVEVFTTTGEPSTFTAIDNSTLPINWAKSSAVLIRVDSNASTARWSFRVEEPGLTPAESKTEVVE